MIAAGHPDLFFDWIVFSGDASALEDAARIRSGNGRGSRVGWWWRMERGQLSSCARNGRLAWRRDERTQEEVWPEYSELSCFACHTRWGRRRQLAAGHGYGGGRPGDPAWNGSRYAVFRLLAQQMDSASAQELERQLSPSPAR